MRSITKTFGLASARIGFLISHKNSIKSFKALQTPYPVSLFSGKSLEYFFQVAHLPVFNQFVFQNWSKSMITTGRIKSHFHFV